MGRIEAGSPTRYGRYERVGATSLSILAMMSAAHASMALYYQGLAAELSR